MFKVFVQGDDSDNIDLLFNTEIQAIKKRIELLKKGINSKHRYIGQSATKGVKSL